jgi:biotin synthase-related radical SAM superfamily protein
MTSEQETNLAREPESMAKTESLFRDVNERIATATDRFGSEEAEFVCECADPTCVERVEVPLEVYEGVRAEPTTFILANGHEDDAIETIVQARRRYQIVEKVNRKVVDVVEKLDPRSGEPDLKPG